MAQTKIVLIRMKPELFKDVEAIREELERQTKQRTTTSDAIRTAIATMAAEMKAKKEQSDD